MSIIPMNFIGIILPAATKPPLTPPPQKSLSCSFSPQKLPSVGSCPLENPLCRLLPNKKIPSASSCPAKGIERIYNMYTKRYTKVIIHYKLNTLSL